MTSNLSHIDLVGGHKDENFLCGVVEGFYGRPWTPEQRKELFKKLKRWGMNAYVYAPKDDYKHRAYWRDLYTVEEADHLTSLIAAAKHQGILFFYALSPGLDMTYSSQKEISILKRKLEQVSQFGCEAFALLFDDIESELSKPDKEVYQTFANAQVSVTNEIFNHLNGPRFLFCPTQYCSSRAIPSVAHSEYLNTLGLKLCPQIDIMWTGPKVVSKTLSVESVREILEVLRRPPVIWDNLHANDYDQKRVFLGPYTGRSPELIPLLRGVLTNPNCEFNANTVAIYTLASWSKCNLDTKSSATMSAISADIKLETENEDGTSNEDTPFTLSKNIYHPRVAVKSAIIEWLPDFFIEKEAWGPLLKPQPPIAIIPVIPIIPSINTCMSLTTTTSTIVNTGLLKLPEVNTNQLQTLAEACNTFTDSGAAAISTGVMNSLISATKVVTNESLPNPIMKSIANIEIPSNIPICSAPIPIMNVKCGANLYNSKTQQQFASTFHSNKTITKEELFSKHLRSKENIAEADDQSSLKKCKSTCTHCEKCDENASTPATKSSTNNTIEPMECGSGMIALPSPKLVNNSLINDAMVETIMIPSENTQVTKLDTSAQSDVAKVENEKTISFDDLHLLCDLFYLPFEHGSRGLKLLNEFNWLKTYSHVLLDSEKEANSLKPETQEWRRRAKKFSVLCQSVLTLSSKIACCFNRELVYDLYSYIWDIAGVISLLDAFIKWLALGAFSTDINKFIQSSCTWFDNGWKEIFTSGDQEPWYFRGGLTADLQRLIPIDNGNDLYIYKLPDNPTPNYYKIRPYSKTDCEEVYSICCRVYCDELHCMGNETENLQLLFGDRFIGPFITFHPELSFVIHRKDNKIVGFACAALDAQQFYENQKIFWIPTMCEKYSLLLIDAENLPSYAKETIHHFHNYKHNYISDTLKDYRSVAAVCFLKDEIQEDNSISKRLITVLLAALRSSGSFGVHVSVSLADCNLAQFYSKLGFSELLRDSSNLYLGRKF